MGSEVQVQDGAVTTRYQIATRISGVKRRLDTTDANVTTLQSNDATNNFSGTAAPTANDDSGSGYALGSVWVDGTNDKAYVCLDATATAAVWTEVTQAGGGGGGGSAVGFSSGAATVTKGDTSYLGVGTGTVTATEANAEYYAPAAATLKNLRTYVSANTTGADGNTITIRINGTGTSVVTTYNTGETGLKSDTSNTASVSAGDRISIQVVNQGSGGGAKNLTVESVSFEFA